MERENTAKEEDYLNDLLKQTEKEEELLQGQSGGVVTHDSQRS